jgi:nucleotide-binding universal stress UspA family protein
MDEMSYRTVLVYVDDSKHASERVAGASAVAIRENAHLIGLAVSGANSVFDKSITANPCSRFIGPLGDADLQAARKSLDRFSELAAELGVQSFEQLLVNDTPVHAMAAHSVSADLLIVSQSDPTEHLFSGSDFPEKVATAADCPTLVLPYIGDTDDFSKNIVVAWDGSRPARRAVTAALPLLAKALKVHVVIFVPASPRAYAIFEKPSGENIRQLIARHGTNVDVIEKISSHNGIGSDLLALAADKHASLIVMGCYGHAKISELLFGGVSHYVLQAMAVPVLMMH